MARPMRIPIVSDVSGFLAGTNDVERALDDVASSLDEISQEARDVGDDAGRGLSDGIRDGARDAERAVDDLADSGRNLDRIGDDGEAAFEQISDSARAELGTVEDQVEQVAKDAETAAERMERSFKDAFDTVKRESGDVGDNARRGFDEAAEGAGEFRDEANSTAREAAASFDGSAESIGDAFQEVAANAFAGFGPAGAAAGLAAAAGLGIVFSQIEKNEEAAQRFRDRVGELTAEFADVEFEGSSALEAMYDRMRELAEATDEEATSLSEWKDLAEDVAGVDFGELAKGIAGNDDILRDVVEHTERYREELAKGTAASSEWTEEERTQHLERIDHADEMLEKLHEEEDARATARENQELLHEAGLEDIQEQIEAEEARAERSEEIAERVQETKEAALARERADVAETTEAWSEHFSEIADDGKVTFEEFSESLDQMLEDQRAKAEYWTTANKNLTQDQILVLEQFGEQKYQILDELMNQPPDVRAATLDKMSQAGSTMAQAQVDGYDSTLPDSIAGPTVIFSPDMSEVERARQTLGSNPFRVDVDVRWPNQVIGP